MVNMVLCFTNGPIEAEKTGLVQWFSLATKGSNCFCLKQNFVLRRILGDGVINVMYSSILTTPHNWPVVPIVFISKECQLPKTSY